MLIANDNIKTSRMMLSSKEIIRKQKLVKNKTLTDKSSEHSHYKTKQALSYPISCDSQLMSEDSLLNLDSSCSSLHTPAYDTRYLPLLMNPYNKFSSVHCVLAHMSLLCCVVHWGAAQIVHIRHMCPMLQQPLQTRHLHTQRQGQLYRGMYIQTAGVREH